MSSNHRDSDDWHIGHQIDLLCTSGTVFLRTSSAVGVVMLQQTRQQRDGQIQATHKPDGETPFHRCMLSPIVTAVKSPKFTSLMPDSSMSLRAAGLHSACNSPACW